MTGTPGGAGPAGVVLDATALQLCHRGRGAGVNEKQNKTKHNKAQTAEYETRLELRPLRPQKSKDRTGKSVSMCGRVISSAGEVMILWGKHVLSLFWSLFLNMFLQM